jgi:arginyl-tRNA synthetase
VHREYYLNDAGNQLDTFAASLYARYRGSEPPTDGYHGAVPGRDGRPMRAELGDDVTDRTQAREWGYRDVVGQIERDLAASASTSTRGSRAVVARGAVTSVRACSPRSRSGATYEEDGAVWLRATDYGDQRDRVLVKSDGATTYLCNDLAYHEDKFAPGWEHLIDIWGPTITAGEVAAVGARGPRPPGGEPEVVLGQLVKLLRGGVEVRMSPPAGTIVTLADILDEVDPDVARLTFLLQGIDTAQTFDLDVVTAQSMENPVYYVQYAHARIASIGVGPRRRDRAPPDRSTSNLAPLAHDRELDCCGARGVPRRRRRAARAARTAPGHHVGARLRRALPRLLPRLPRDLRRRRAHAGAALAGRGVPHRSRQRARDPRRARARRDDPPDATTT